MEILLAFAVGAFFLFAGPDPMPDHNAVPVVQAVTTQNVYLGHKSYEEGTTFSTLTVSTPDVKVPKIMPSIRTTEDYLVYRKSPETAMMCSAVFPGWGQHYAGDKQAGGLYLLGSALTYAFLFSSTSMGSIEFWGITGMIVRVADVFTAGGAANEHNKELLEKLHP